MKVNVENLNHVIGVFEKNQWLHAGKIVLGSALAYAGLRLAAGAAYDMGTNEATRNTLRYIVDHKDDEMLEIK